MTEGHSGMIVVSRHDPARDDDLEFVNYNPSNLLNRQHRKTVHAFASGFHKRKSKPAQPGLGRPRDAGKVATTSVGRPPAPPGHAVRVRRKGKDQPHEGVGYHLGGLRTDPFNAYPVQARDAVTQAVDVYCQIWAPTHVGEYAPGRESNLLLSELFPLALQHVGLFEALVAWSQCFSATYYKQDNFMTKEVFYHRGNAISELRTSLLPSAAVSSDAAILTLCFLMAIEYVTGDVATFETLLHGIYQLVTNAGGLDKLGLRGLTKGMIVRIEKEWTRRRNQKSRYTETKPTECLEYPIHPFRSDLCNAIAKMPKGFRDLALEAVLSTQMLQILERMSEWHTRTEHLHQHVATPDEIRLLQAHEPQIEAEEAYRCLEILMSSGAAGGIERCLFIGLIAYSLEVFTRTKFNAELYWAVQDLTMALEVIEPEPMERECLIWLSMVAVSTCKGSLSQKGSEMVERVLRDHPSLKEWGKMEEMLRKFFWFDSLAGEWKKRWSAAVGH